MHPFPQTLVHTPPDAPPIQKTWQEQRTEDLAYTHRSPDVLIVGSGQGGLGVAAWSKAYGVDALCIDRNGRVGDTWRKRYKSLRLHDPVWYDHMPFIPCTSFLFFFFLVFATSLMPREVPSSWPVYTPASKLADWLESYAHSLELNVWTSTNIISADFDEKTEIWRVELVRGNGERRTFFPKFVVWAAGIGGGEGVMPKIPGMVRYGLRFLPDVSM